jgi:hypothetical protein
MLAGRGNRGLVPSQLLAWIVKVVQYTVCLLPAISLPDSLRYIKELGDTEVGWHMSRGGTGLARLRLHSHGLG